MLSITDLKAVTGGGINWIALGGILGGIFTFFAGVVEGFTNATINCSKK